MFSDLASPTEAGFAKTETGFHPRIRSEGMFFGFMFDYDRR
jgi:hypothetical protein